MRALLIILDGFGIGKDSPFNAIKNAKMPFYNELWNKYPHSQLLTHGEAVGLPAGIMGNSEVGHMTMGAGRIIYQDLTRISKSITDGDFFKNETILETFRAGSQNGATVHLMGLLSDGGVHSDISHLKALLDLALKLGTPRVAVHAFLDGRDTPPDSAPKYVQDLLSHPAFSPSQTRTRAVLASLHGRYFVMDRDQRWERVERSYRVLMGQEASTATDALSAIQTSYANGKTDEFIEPVLLNSDFAMKSGDSVLFFNYRSDRAREITAALTEKEFTHFDRKTGFTPSVYTGMTRYDQKLSGARVAYGAQNTENILAKCLESAGRTQFRTAETEKYAHVTFFFNAGREQPFIGEDRLLIPSPRDVETYDQKPEMSAFEVAQAAEAQLRAQKHDFYLMNFANADMVGHTGNYEATVRAMEALDQCLSRVVGAAQQSNTHVLLTADHGNAEEMRDCSGKLHTQHTLNPVPGLWIAPNTAIAPRTDRIALHDGGLSDIMPTLCDLMGLPIPAEVTGKSLLPKQMKP